MKKITNINIYKGVNALVITHYLDIIVKGLCKSDILIRTYTSVYDLIIKNRNSLCVVAEAKHMCFLYFIGFRKFVFWAQGVVGAESYLRNHSRLRMKVLDCIEKFALKKSKVCFVVSQTQLKYYENKYNLFLKDKTVVMPCFNTSIKKSSFFYPNKYERNVFCYIGSLAVWQCFEDAIKLYSLIEKNSSLPCFLKVYTKNRKEAENIIIRYNIHNYVVDFLPQEKLDDALADCKYGFLLREDNIVNNVATPTKMSTYLANGVIPIYSNSLIDFSSLFNGYNFAVCLSDKVDYITVQRHMNIKISVNEIYGFYHKIFETYYNESIYLKRIEDLDYVKTLNFV